MNLLDYAVPFIQQQMTDPPRFIHAICGGKGLQGYMVWNFSMLVAQKQVPELKDLEPEMKRELWETAKDAIHNSGYECTKELGIIMCKSLIVIQMLK